MKSEMQALLQSANDDKFAARNKIMEIVDNYYEKHGLMLEVSTEITSELTKVGTIKGYNTFVL